MLLWSALNEEEKAKVVVEHSRVKYFFFRSKTKSSFNFDLFIEIK